MDLLSYDFMQRALIASLLVGLTAPTVGVYLVLRRRTADSPRVRSGRLRDPR